MAPASPHIVNQLRQLIYYHLDNNLLRNALFFAGRLQAYECRSSEAAYLLSLCHFRLGQLKSAYDYSRSSGSRGTHLGCAYIFAQSCLALEKYLEGITALERSRTLWSARSNWNKHTDSRRQHLPDAAAVHCLLGKLWQGQRNLDKAIDSYAEALKLNPFMWDAFLSLCDLGVNVRIPNVFQMTPEMRRLLQTSPTDENTLETLDESPPPNPLSQSQATNNINISSSQPSSNDPFSISKNRINGDVRPNLGSSALFEKLNGSRTIITPISGGDLDYQEMDTPTGPSSFNSDTLSSKDFVGNGMISMTSTLHSAEPPLAPMRKGRTLHGMGVDLNTEAPPKMRSHSIKAKSRTKPESEDLESASLNKQPSMSFGINHKRTASGHAAPSTTGNSSSNQATNSGDPMAPQRRSIRLFNQIRPQNGKFSVSGSIGTKEGRELKKAKATGTKSRSANALNVGRVVSGNRKHGELMEIDGKEQRNPSTSHSSASDPMPRPASNESTKEKEALKWLFELFIKLGSGYFALSHYQCQDAIQILNSITPSQRETPWVLAQIGKALYEQGMYTEAEKYFARIKTMAPARLEDMEVYSTVLWHTKNDIDLAFLAHEITDLDRTSPQAWCAIGNSFSLQRDHDQALKCFRRATQLDPKFAYAFTLQGHEHVANEEYDKALGAYRSGIAIESRHYNAWYGLGKVFEKQGKYEFAEQHYRTAAAINPTNAVLVCCIGVVLEKMKNPQAALAQYSRSCDLAPQSALSRFKKARVLMALQQPREALAELLVLKDIAPDEANVHFLLGRVYKNLGQKSSAIRHFTTSLNLDPKASHYIKEAMEQMEDEDDDYDAP
ncbi:MAG: hypothetical protein Q9167_002631 [Letrouitia subvulpina]